MLSPRGFCTLILILQKRTSSITLRYRRPFEAHEFAEKINQALSRGENEAAELIVGLSNNERQAIREPYRIRYGKDLLQSLDEKFTGDLQKLIFALMDTPLDYDLKHLNGAMKGLGTDESTLIEIICSRTPDQLRAIRANYEEKFGTPLEKAVAGDTSGEFKDFFVALVTGSKDASHDTNDAQAKDDAVRLFADGKDKFVSTDGPSHFLNILATQNMYQLRKVFAEFEALAGTTIEKAIEEEASGDLRTAYLAIARASTNKQRYFAHQLFDAMKGLGTSNNDLIRVLLTRSEVDLHLIREEYKKLFGKTLEEDIKDYTLAPTVTPSQPSSSAIKNSEATVSCPHSATVPHRHSFWDHNFSCVNSIFALSTPIQRLGHVNITIVIFFLNSLLILHF